MKTELGKKESHFKHEADIGIIGRGETIENCFADTAKVMFALTIDLSKVTLAHIITFEFQEEDVAKALTTWLNLLISKSKEHHLLFGDFRLKRVGKTWQATVAGEPLLDGKKHDIELKKVISKLLSVEKIDHVWEARCVVEIS